MNTKTFIQSIRRNTGRKLTFELPDGSFLGGDLHITEIKHQDIKSVDCGGNAHAFQETVVQLWINEGSEKEADWTSDKALSIIDKVGKVQSYTDEAELFIEFGDKKRPTIKYTVTTVEENQKELTVKLRIQPTACKPSLSTNQLAACC